MRGLKQPLEHQKMRGNKDTFLKDENPKGENVDPRIMRIIRKKARKTIGLFAIPLVLLLIVLNDWTSTLVLGFFFSCFLGILYPNIQYFLLSRRYPDRFPSTSGSSPSPKSATDFCSDTINNPAYRSLSSNLYNQNR